MASSSNQGSSARGADVAQKRNLPILFNPTSFVTFIVGKGENQEKFIIHKEFVCHNSPVLNAAFNGPFLEGQTQTYYLDDIAPSVFRLLATWFYTQSIESFWTVSDDQVLSTPSPEKGYMNLIEVYILADRLIIPILQKEILQSLEAYLVPKCGHGKKCKGRCAPKTSWIAKAYANTLAGNQLRRLALDHCQCVLLHRPKSITMFAEKPEKFPKELLFDLVSEYSEFPPKTYDYDETRRVAISRQWTPWFTSYPPRQTALKDSDAFDVAVLKPNSPYLEYSDFTWITLRRNEPISKITDIWAPHREPSILLEFASGMVPPSTRIETLFQQNEDRTIVLIAHDRAKIEQRKIIAKSITAAIQATK